jgi:hypothetical protein
MYRYIVEKIPDKTRSKEDRERSEYRKMLKSRLRKGEPINDTEAIQMIGEASLKRVKKDAALEPFAESFKRLSFREAMEVFSIATQREKDMSREILDDKYNRMLKRKPDDPRKLTEDEKDLYYELIYR